MAEVLRYMTASLLELPAALVEELLKTNENVGESLLNSMNAIQDSKKDIREWLVANQKLRRDSALENVAIPTTCGVDGSYVIERMISTSIVACAAVAVEGFTPPSETKYWPLKHESLIEVENHEPELGTILRGLMKFMEMKLAVNAPQDIVLMDGSITSQFIHVNQAVNMAKPDGDGHHSTKKIGKKLLDEYHEFLKSFKIIMESKKDNRIWASLPKFTTRSELGDEMLHGWPEKQDDRSVLTAVLMPGEFTIPKKITRTQDNWHLHLPDVTDEYAKELISQNEDLMTEKMNVIYYKPHDYTPALRIEMAEDVAKDDSRLTKLLKSISYQFASYAIMEPYPLYMADRMVQNLSGAMPALRQSALQKVIKETTASIDDVLYSLRSYRTEGGR